MKLKPYNNPCKREMPPIGKLSFTEDDIRNSAVIKKQIERVKQFSKGHPFPIKLL